MFQRFASTTFVAGALLSVLIPGVGFARDHEGNSGGGRSSAPTRSARNGGSHFSGGRSSVSPRGPSYSRGYIAPRSYGRPIYRGYHGGSVALGFGVPYGYAYGPGYAYAPATVPAYPYDPNYSSGYSYGPAPAPQSCVPGTYDRNGNWIQNPNCYADQQQYQQAPQQNYDPDQQPYPQQQQNYAPTPPQGYSR